MAGPVGAPDPDDQGRIPVRRYRLKLLGVLGALILLMLLLRGQYRRELYHLTGEASWMWVGDDVSRARPEAGLFVRSFTLSDRPRRAVAKVCGDRQYVLWINSFLVWTGHNRPGFVLDVVPVTDLLHPGRNVIAIEASSPTSVGAVLFSLDIDPGPVGVRSGDPRGRNAVVSGLDWTVVRRWEQRSLETGNVVGGHPWIWGTPPDHPWSYPSPCLRPVPLVQAMAGEPRLLGGGLAEGAGDRIWRYRLGDRFRGLVWIVLDGKDVTEWTVHEEKAGDGAGRIPVHVVPLPGADRWLVPGIVRGPILVLDGPRVPPDLVTVAVSGETTGSCVPPGEGPG